MPQLVKGLSNLGAMIRQYPSLLHRHFLEHSHSEMAGEEKLLKASRLRFIFHMTPINIFLFFLPFVFARLLIPLNSGAFGENNFVPLSYLTKPGWDQRVYSIICLWYGRRASIKVPVILSHLSPRLAQSHTHLYFFIIYFIVSASLSRAFCVKHFSQRVFNTISTSHWILYPIPFPLLVFFLDLPSRPQFKEKIETIKYFSTFPFYIFSYSRFVSELWLNYLRVCGVHFVEIAFVGKATRVLSNVEA